MNDNEIIGGSQRYDGWTAERRSRFLAHLEQTGNVAGAARAVGKSVSGAYQLRRRDPEFASAWDEALDRALDELESVVLDRVINGIEKPIFYAGKQCGSIRQYSDSLAMFMLKARRPDVYGRVAALNEQPDGTEADRARAEMEERLHKLGRRLAA